MKALVCLGLALSIAACSKNGPPAASAKSDPANAPRTTHQHPGCGADGLYALPTFDEEDLKRQPAAPAAVAAFRDANSAYESGDPALATKKFFEAARALSNIQKDAPLADWAVMVRELAYHNALWAASVAGKESEARLELEKSSGGDSDLASEIDSLLAEPPAECSK